MDLSCRIGRCALDGSRARQQRSAQYLLLRSGGRRLCRLLRIEQGRKLRRVGDWLPAGKVTTDVQRRPAVDQRLALQQWMACLWLLRIPIGDDTIRQIGP